MKPEQSEGNEEIRQARIRELEIELTNELISNLRQSLAELIPIAEAGQAYYRQNPGFDWVREREKCKSAIERAKKLL